MAKTVIEINKALCPYSSANRAAPRWSSLDYIPWDGWEFNTPTRLLLRVLGYGIGPGGGNEGRTTLANSM